jgi:nucleoside-diphosphate-sugar epimerase
LGRVLITGGAGFIGSDLVDKPLAEGCNVTVVDNFDPFLKRVLTSRISMASCIDEYVGVTNRIGEPRVLAFSTG